MSANFAQDLATQSWTLYGVGMFLIIYRTYARWRRVGSITKFAADDWIMVTAVILFYTGLMVTPNIIASGGGSNLYLPGQFETFSDEEIQARIQGSKIVIISEQCMLNAIWSLKACMLFMYARMFSGTTRHKWIKIIAACTFASWLACQITFFAACRPFRGYWAMPPPSPQCSGLENYAIVQITFNVFSDLLIIALPIPIIASLTLPIKQKIGLGFLSSMGSFVIIAAIVNKYFTFKDIFSPEYMFWYTREASVAVYVTNLPGIWPLLREHISFLRDQSTQFRSNASNPSSSRYGNFSKASKAWRASKGPRNRVRTNENPESDEVELGTSFAKSGVRYMHSHGTMAINEEERANPFSNSTRSGRASQDSDERAINEAMHDFKGMEVQIDTKVEIQRSGWNDPQLEKGQANFVQIEGPDNARRRS